MPERQKQPARPRVFDAPKPKKRPRNRSQLRMHEVGPGVGLQHRFAKDGTLIVRLVSIHEKRVSMLSNGVPRDTIEKTPKPGWVSIRNIRLEDFTELLGDLQSEARKALGLERVESEPMMYKPFEGLGDLVEFDQGDFDLGVLLQEASEEASRPVQKKRRRNRTRKRQRVPGPARFLASAQHHVQAIEENLDRMTKASSEFRKKHGG